MKARMNSRSSSGNSTDGPPTAERRGNQHAAWGPQPCGHRTCSSRAGAPEHRHFNPRSSPRQVKSEPPPEQQTATGSGAIDPGRQATLPGHLREQHLDFTSPPQRPGTPAGGEKKGSPDPANRERLAAASQQGHGGGLALADCGRGWSWAGEPVAVWRCCSRDGASVLVQIVCDADSLRQAPPNRWRCYSRTCRAGAADRPPGTTTIRPAHPWCLLTGLPCAS
jgi:hypothetical protein